MPAILFRIFGLSTFIFLLLMIIVFKIQHSRQPTVFDNYSTIRILIFDLATLVIGIGLMYQRQWAARIFSLVTAGVGFWLIISLILYVPFAFNLINICIGFLFLIPITITLGLETGIFSKDETFP